MVEAGHKTDHPGVYIPPPFIYVFMFLISLGIQKIFPWSFAHSGALDVLGWVMALVGISMGIIAILQFQKTGNHIVPIRSATSLQTGGIYAWTRNPMYTGLILVYIGIGNVFGNWWTFILIPVLIMIVRFYIIGKEENYLSRTFGDEYLQYKKKVRRWI